MRKWAIQIQILIISIVISSACSMEEPTQSIQNTATIIFKQETKTEEPLPTQTHTPTQKFDKETPHPTATITPYPTLSPDTPKLLSPIGGFLEYHTLVIENVNVVGRKIIQLPNSGRISSLDQAISPNGKLCAYFIGSAYDENPIGISLNIINLEDQSNRKISSLISNGFPEVLLPIAEKLYEENQDDENCKEVDCWIRPTESAFLGGIESFAWSPNTKYLAFAAQIDTVSSQLYVFDLENESYQKMTDNFYSIKDISWSPDGAWVLYEITIPGQIYDASGLYAIDIETGVKRTIVEPKMWWFFKGWLSPTKILTSKMGASGSFPYDLQFTDLNTGEVNVLWNDHFLDLEVDYEKQLIGIIHAEYHEDRQISILFPSEEKIEIELPDIYELNAFNGESAIFIGVKINEIVAISEDGEIQIIDNEPAQGIEISPNKKWFIIRKGNTIELYNKSLVLAHKYKDLNFLDWGRNSTGLYFFKDQEIYFSSVFDGKSKLVYKCDKDEQEYCPEYISEIIEAP